jgi:hypothetical protein
VHARKASCYNRRRWFWASRFFHSSSTNH